MHALSGLDPVLGSGLWLSVADEDVALTALGAPRGEKYVLPPGGELRGVPHAIANCATLANLFEWTFRDCCADDDASAHLKARAVRFADRYADELAIRRFGSRP